MISNSIRILLLNRASAALGKKSLYFTLMYGFIYLGRLVSGSTPLEVQHCLTFKYAIKAKPIYPVRDLL